MTLTTSRLRRAVTAVVASAGLAVGALTAAQATQPATDENQAYYVTVAWVKNPTTCTTIYGGKVLYSIQTTTGTLYNCSKWRPDY